LLIYTHCVVFVSNGSLTTWGLHCLIKRMGHGSYYRYSSSLNCTICGVAETIRVYVQRCCDLVVHLTRDVGEGGR
jgi:hypothetical protein